MTEKEMEREMNYLVCRNITLQLLRNGVIDDSDYHQIEARLLDKFPPLLGELYQ